MTLSPTLHHNHVTNNIPNTTNTVVTSLIYYNTSLISGTDRGILTRWRIPKESFNDYSSDNSIFQQHHQQRRPIFKTEPIFGNDNHSGAIWSMDIDFDNNYLVTGGSDRTVKLWNLSTANCKSTFRFHNHWVNAVKIKKNNILSGGEDGLLCLFSIQNNKKLCQISTETTKSPLSISWFGNNIAMIGSRDGSVKQYDLETKELISSTEDSSLGHRGACNTIHWNEEYSLIVSGSSDNSLQFYDFRDKSRVVYSVKPHNAAILSLQLKNNILVTGSFDKTLKIFDIRCLYNSEKINVLKTLEGHSNAVFCLQFDHEKIISGSSDHTIRIWCFNPAITI